MTPLQTIRTVALRELRERALTKGYIAGTLVTVLVVVAAIALPTILGGDDEPATLGVVGDAPADLEALLSAGSAEVADAGTDLEAPTGDAAAAGITVTELADRDAAEAAIEDGEVDAVLLDGRQLLADGTPDPTLRATLEGALQIANLGDNLADAGLSADETAAALTPAPPLEVVDVAGEEAGTSIAIATIATILLVITISGNGMTLLSAALEEKSSRVVEVLVSTARPWQLLAGKLLAMAALAMGQLVLIIAAGLGTNAALDAYTLPPATGLVLATSAVLVPLGFLFYASMFAAAGSMATSIEDSASTVNPLMYLMFGAYGGVFATVIPNPSGIVATVLSYLPPTAPFAVPARVALGVMPAWQIVLAVLSTAVGTFLVVRLAGRIYAGTLLAGGKVGWRAALQTEPVR